VARIETERSANQLTVIIHTAKPGIVIGRSGASVDALRDNLERISGKKVRVTIQEIKTPELDAQLVAENVANQLEKRIAFRRAVKQSVMRSMRAGAKGVRIQVSGRLGGGDMSRREWDRDGRVPLHTLRADIDFGQSEAKTTFGQIGVSAWIYRGDYSEPQVTAAPPQEIGSERPTAIGSDTAETEAEAAPETAIAEEPPIVDEAAEMVSEGSPVLEPEAEVAPTAPPAKPRARTRAAKAPAEAEVAPSAGGEAQAPAKPAARTRRAPAKAAAATPAEKKPPTPRKRAAKPAAPDPGEEA
jgi:small subunit ribosomal protein S3